MHRNAMIASGFGIRMTAAAVLALVAFTNPAQAQTGGTIQHPRLSLGIAAGTDDVETELQLKLAVPAGVTVGKIEAVLTFPDTLKFERIAGYLVDQRRVKADTQVQQPADGKRALLLTLQSADPAGPLPVDALAKIVFKVAKGVKPTVIDVALQAKTFAPDGREVKPVDVYPGRINIQERAVFFGCFFYMH